MEIGETLREARMRQEIDISDVEEKTKIRAKFLRALENEEWQVIPEDVYVRKFLESYAVALGLDPRPLVELYVIRTAAPDPHSGSRPTLRAGISTGGSRAKLFLGSGFALGLIVLLLIGSGRL
ncbi:MAG: helix-turn-helix domain-containing protein [Solirubrobacterales bacterium]|nr:helix-turn-helix domain-containing protein [Solirubrobacterales bacterium]